MCLDTSSDTEFAGRPPQPSWLSKGWGYINSLGFYSVVLPTLLAAIYFGLIASDVYISESRLVLRSPHQPSPTGLGALLQGAGVSNAQSDTFSVRDFILSRDALSILNEQSSLEKTFGSGQIDIFNRFGGLDWWNRNFEGLHRYYTNRVVGVMLDSTSSIVTLTVRAFSPEEAWRINEKLVEMSEELVNRLNERIHNDMIRYALTDVEAAEKKAGEAVLAVARFRNLKSVFDPEKQSPLQLGLIEKLQGELIDTKSQLAQISSLTKDNPQIPSLQKQVQSLQEAIDSETQKVAGGSQSLSNKAAEYERLAFAREFAAKQLAAAMASLDVARNEARRKEVYLERLVQPGKPDVAVEPRRLRGVLAVLALGMVTWGILNILLAGVREHRD